MLHNNTPDIEIGPALLDNLSAHIGIINNTGIILSTNQAWQNFNDANTQIKRPGKNSNYFDSIQEAVEMGNDYALKIFLGLKKILKKEQASFTLAYPLETPQSYYWFNITIHPCNDDHTQFAIIHEDISSAMQVKKEHRKNGNRYQLQFEQSLDGILITDTKGHILDANPAASSILGWSPAELLTLSRNEIMDAQDPNYIEALKNRKTKGIYKLEMDMIHKNGDKIPVEVSSRANRTHSRDGNLRAIVSFRDIGRRKAAESKLVAAKKFTESALNSIPSIFFVLDVDANLIRWNENLVEKLGYTDEELKQLNAGDFVTGRHQSEIRAGVEKAIKEGTLSFETRLVAKDGTTTDYDIHVKRFIENDAVYLVGTGIDITERNSAELEKRRHQTMMEQLFENAPVGITIVDTQNNIQRVNKSFEQIFDYSEKELLYKNIDEILVPLSRKTEAQKINYATFNGTSLQVETVRQKKDMKEVPVLVASVPVTFEKEIISIYGIYVDISEQHNYQQKVEENLREKDALLAELHHRVKNNLALISSLIELQLDETADAKEKDGLNNTKTRILTIAAIHEVLYQSGNLSKIPFSNFLQKLIAETRSHYAECTEHITFELDFDDIFLDIDQSIPVGLFLNELLTLIFSIVDNTKDRDFKISFNEADDETINLTLTSKNRDSNLSELQNNNSLHAVLIKTLVSQLNGTLLWPAADQEHQEIVLIFSKKSNSRPARSLIK